MSDRDSSTVNLVIILQMLYHGIIIVANVILSDHIIESLQKQINVIYSRLSDNPFTRDYFNGKSHTFHKDDIRSEDK